MSIEENYGKVEKFTFESWILWKANHFETAINNSRTAKQLKYLSTTNPGWEKIARELLISEPRKLKLTTETPEDKLVKAGLICHAPGKADEFTFGSPAIRLLLFQQLLHPIEHGIS